MGLVLADSAYASGEALDAFAAAGYDTAIKPIDPKPRITGGFTRDDFTIDTDAQTVTCPAGHTKAVTSAAARFGALCRGCPLRGPLHHLRRRAQRHRGRIPPPPTSQQDPAGPSPPPRAPTNSTAPWPNAPSRGSPANKARRVPYRGVAANHLWLTTRAAAVNLVRLTNLGVTHHNGAFTL